MFDYEERNLLAFAAKLKRARINAGLSQQDLADLAGCKQFDITRYENAKMFPQDDEILKRIADVLKLDPYYLKYNEGDSYTIKETEYGREIVLNHISRDYVPKNVERSIHELTKDRDLNNDREFYKTFKANYKYLSEDDKSVLLDFLRLLVLDSPRGYELFEKQMKENKDYIDGHMRFHAPRVKKR